MICVVDMDGTFLKNDFFMESFFIKLLSNPFYLIRHFMFSRRSLLELKHKLLADRIVEYDIDFLANKQVKDYLYCYKNKFSKIVLVTATPQFFASQLLKEYSVFDEVHGSEDVNLKNKAKLKFIIHNFGENFAYIGDSKADDVIFKNAKIGLKVKGDKLIDVKN